MDQVTTTRVNIRFLPHGVLRKVMQVFGRYSAGVCADWLGCSDWGTEQHIYGSGSLLGRREGVSEEMGHSVCRKERGGGWPAVPWAVPNSPIPLGLFAHESVHCFWPIIWPGSVSVCELYEPRLSPAWASLSISEHVPVTSFMAKEGSITPTPDIRWTHGPEVSHLTCIEETHHHETAPMTLFSGILCSLLSPILGFCF